MDKKRSRDNPPQPDPMPAESLTPQQPGEKSGETPQKLEDLVRLMLSGPLDLYELMEAAAEMPPDSTTPGASYWEKEQMLQNIREKKGYMVPTWWRSSPEKFHEMFNDRITPQILSKDDTLEQRQLSILEVLLNIWSEHLSEGMS
jgi:hypothetical protein